MSREAKKDRALTELSITELLEKQREIQFVGTQYAMNGCEPPPALTVEYEAVVRELERRPGRAKS
jgi:hypothetical protein